MDSLKNLSNKFWRFSQEPEEPTLPEQSLEELPPKLAQQLKNSIENLPIPLAIQQAVKGKTLATIHEWQQNPDITKNSLIILGSPLEDFDEILRETLLVLQAEIEFPIRLLDWLERPTDMANIVNKLVQQLGRGTIITTEQPREIVLISNLCWCFLRSVEGLEGIDYLKETILSDRSRFWLIACNQIAWDYLDYVCQLPAYFEEIFVLPTLDDQQLQIWLTPVMKTMAVNFCSEPEPDKIKKAQANFFKQVEVISEGISPVAAQLLMRSLAYQTPDEDNNHQQSQVKTKSPSLPKLPKLFSPEHYLLYSVLLHHEISLSHLADSLGDDPAIVQNYGQNLRRQGVIQESNHILRVNPLYYPKLTKELDGNNFPISK